MEQRKERAGRDLFEELAGGLGRRFVSDLCRPPYRWAARYALLGANHAGYPVNVWRDMLEYLGVPGARQANSEADAKRILRGALGTGQDE